MLAVACLAGVAGGATAQAPGAQTPPAQPCTTGGIECLAAAQQQQVAKVGDDVMARRVAAGIAAAAAVRQFVDFWVAYATQVGYGVAFGYLPG